MLTNSEAISELNDLGASRKPFRFYCDFLGEKWCIEEDSQSNSSLQLKIDSDSPKSLDQKLTFEKHPIAFDDFKKSFDEVVHQINIGNSFLTNLTFETPITANLSLSEIFSASRAKYKLLVPDQFVVFSPETFIKIKKDSIYSYPMKGTIDAALPNAHQSIMDDVKETAEHVTIVDLIRNDLSQVARNVEVTKFRYIDRLSTHDKELLQVSSEIRGDVGENWCEQIGDILAKLLPAGSISGAPKPETLKIIQQNEDFKREFYTGICGQFDGEQLDTGVMIRFIKQVDDQLIFCSGGGITSFSDAQKEYQEMVDKVYLPI